MSTPVATLNQLNLVAEDFDATLAFYQRLGLHVNDLPPHYGIRHARVTLSSGLTLEFDNLTLARKYNAAWRTSEASSRVVLGFALPTREAVDRRYAELIAAGYRSRQSPYDAFWGARYAIVADPNGVDVGLMSPIDETRRTFPPTDSPAR